MTLYSNRLLLSVGIAMSALAVSITGCTKVDDNLGVNIIPSGQQMSVAFASLQNGINTYITLSDSIKTSGLDYAYFGRMKEDGFGITTASALVQFTPSSRTDTIVYTNRTSVPDSLWILASTTWLGGDTLKTETFDVYRLKKRMYQDSTYYSGINYKEYIDSAPMFTCTMTGGGSGTSAYDTLRLKVANAALAAAFMNELWNMDTLYYTNDTLFIDKFNGLCLTPSGTSPEDAAIYGINLTWSSTYGPYSYLMFFGHDYLTGGDASVAEDQIRRAYKISDNTSHTKQAAATSIVHDYSTTSFASQININPQKSNNLGSPVSTTYVQGVLGVTTTVEFTDDFVAELKALVPEGKSIFINQAVMYAAVKEPSYADFDVAPTRLGTYTNYGAISAVADYNYYYEANSQSVTLSYGGYLNRSHGWYSMDIAIYMQQLLNGKESTRRLTLGMSAYDYFTLGRVALLGTGSATPVKLSLTYTVIGK